ncbi:sugar ABC transporter permease [Paenibacillus sp. F411]|uniref:Binding-protein-dependent transporters inner membrane component n=1 Tax=Paenibacillus algicola TaxID=2565926 RepID=A0A4P8XHT4_9BACL|nr:MULTISPECIES: sugar ABC transporter permease [Paenibacillus]MBO2943326.1 sugar ABC transporter permease [Paenibacillus sp. F411]QCT02112.1 binding-protein-dependent transporters inner membrane component [Paenibacillus algicola]
MNKFLGNKTAILLFISPALLLFTVLVFWPILQVFYRSLFEWDGLTEGTFIFLDNYKRMFEDSLFYTSLYNGLIFALILTVLQISIGTVLALTISDGLIKGRKLLRISFFIPVVLSITVVCQLWLAIYNGEYGLINKIFEALGLSYRQDWLSNSKTAIFAIAMVNAWQYMGYHFALLLAAARSIPEQYMEAAKIDGAERWTAHWKITIPLMAETYKFCLVLAITGGLNAFANMYIMTGGGPGTSTYTLTYMMYRSAFRVGEFGYGSASAAFLVIECLIVTFAINRLVARERIVY